MILALSYILMLALPQQRPFVALGGNLTPIGASANIAAIGIPFTLAAVLTGYGRPWLVWG